VPARAAVFAAVLLATGGARADAPPAEVVAAPPGPAGSPWAAGAAVVPGLIVVGSGHWVLGERAAAVRLLETEAVALAGMALGGALLWGSRASAPLAPLYVVPGIGGLGLLTVAWLTDVIGAVHGARDWPAPRPPPGTLTVTAGYAGLYGSPFDFHGLLDLRASWRGDRFVVMPFALVEPGGAAYVAAGGRGAVRLWRRAGDAVTQAGLVAGVLHQRFGPAGFHVTAGEAAGEARVNLGLLARTMRNAYGLGRLGVGLEGYGYAAPDAAGDARPYLVLEVGLGLQATRRVGLELLYRHRKNELPGGLVTGGFSFLGMVEAAGRVQLGERWAVLPGLRYGNGVMPWIAVESRLY
jgi:hypothetical protein